jgi:hypothetical protein
MNATCRLLVEGSEGTDQLSEVLLASKVKPPPVKLPPDPVLEKFVRQIGGHATSVCLRAVLLWLTWHRTEAHAAVLLGPGCHGRSCKSARRRAVVLWLLTSRHGRSLSRSARRRAAVQSSIIVSYYTNTIHRLYQREVA